MLNTDYTALENELAQTVANIESTHPGYDEYRYSVDEIGHNPYELASYLSAKYHVYFREQVQDETWGNQEMMARTPAWNADLEIAHKAFYAAIGRT